MIRHDDIDEEIILLYLKESDILDHYYASSQGIHILYNVSPLLRLSESITISEEHYLNRKRTKTINDLLDDTQ